MNKSEIASSLISGLIAAATSIGSVLANHTGAEVEITQVMIITTVTAFVIHAGKELKKGLEKQ